MHRSVFLQLSSYLAAHRPLWQIAPFECQQLPWQDEYPELEQGLNQLTDSELTRLMQDEAAAQHWFANHIGEIPSSALGLAPAFTPEWLTEPQPPIEPPFWLLNGVKGRKSEQIVAFSAQLPSAPTQWLEWCAGKGHLGRVAQYQTHRQITSIEWQQALCCAGQAIADQLHCQQHFVQANVLTEDLSNCFTAAQGVMALHACGELHLQLLKQARQHQVQHILVCPCCYHLINDDQYVGLSEQAKTTGLVLSKRDLKLPLQQLVTTGQRGRRLRDTELHWRLSFSQYVQLLTGSRQYTPLPNFAKALLSQDFAAFCRWVCETKAIDFDPSLLEASLARGQNQLALVNKIELVRQRFRRILEFWLVLDRVCFLEEAGYRVTVMPFCDFSVTPRNLLIKAELV
ncbi:methyltransferase [Motilimonas sp. KMU-193]|uniref:methyltransferase n=1 Tax=Motilimonas sp. KMU-193 TaxID=3388668 RepID=UPI00396B1E3C